MRKSVVLVVALVALLVPQAIHAQEDMPRTRQEVIQLEGMEETITTTYVESPKGYSLWIDTAYLVPQPEDEGVGMDVYASPNSTPEFTCELLVYQSGLYDYSFEQAIEDTRQVLMDNYGNADELENVELFANLRGSGLCATADDNTVIYYLAGTETEVFHLVIHCPNEALEGFASRVIWMLKSFEAHGEQP